MEFKQQLKTLREQEGLTQEELALRLNISRSAIAKWEQGKGMPSLDLLKSLSLFFHISIDELLGEEGLMLFKKNQKRKNLVIVSIAVASLALATVSSILYINELQKRTMNVPLTEIAHLNEVVRYQDYYEVTYESDDESITIDIPLDKLSFRHLDDWDFGLSVNDYLAITRTGDIVSEAVLIDNSTTAAIKGYQVEIDDGDASYEYYYHEYMVHDYEYPYLSSESDIPYLGSSHLGISNDIYNGREFSKIHVSHEVFVSKNLGPDTYLSISFLPISMEGVDQEPQFLNSTYIQYVISINADIRGYLNNYAYEGQDYSMRDVVSYDITFSFVDTIDTLLVRQYDDNDILLVENTLEDDISIANFSIDEDASYLRYFIDGSLRGRTLETGENQSFYIDNGTPLVTVFTLNIDTDY